MSVLPGTRTQPEAGIHAAAISLADFIAVRRRPHSLTPVSRTIPSLAFSVGESLPPCTCQEMPAVFRMDADVKAGARWSELRLMTSSCRGCPRSPRTRGNGEHSCCGGGQPRERLASSVPPGTPPFVGLRRSPLRLSRSGRGR